MVEENPVYSEKQENIGHSYDAIFILPYTHVNKRGREVMSHFTARAVLAGYELYQNQIAPFIIIPGEEKNPSTADLERDFLIKKGVEKENIFTYSNLNGTLEQLKILQKLQKSGVGRVLIVAFDFHSSRVKEYLEQLGVSADIAVVENIREKYSIAGSAKKERLLMIPQLAAVKEYEQKAGLLKRIGEIIPIEGVAKFILGPSITDIQGGKPVVGIKRIEEIKKLFRKFMNKDVSR